MKIVHVVAYYNPVWKYQENYLAEEQAKLGHEVHIVASDLNFPYNNYPFTAQKDLGPRQKKAGSFYNGQYRVHYLPVKREFSGRVWLTGLIEKIISLAPDLLICHGVTQPSAFQILSEPRLTCIKIADEHILYSDLGHSRLKRVFLSVFGWLFHKKLSSGFQKIVAIADGTRDVLIKLLKIDPSHIQLLPLGTDTDFFKPDKAAGELFRSAHGIGADELVVGYTGKIEPRKRIELLLEVLNDPGMPPARLLIAGNHEDEYAGTLLEKVKHSRIPVTILPSQPRGNLPGLYNACNVLAWPAHQTISMMDAAACGRPFICADYLSERLQKGQGWGIPAGNREKLAEALQFLLSNPGKLIDMGHRARQWAEEELSWKKVNEAFITL